jgi:Tfp pilus assembly protein PilN
MYDIRPNQEYTPQPVNETPQAPAAPDYSATPSQVSQPVNYGPGPESTPPAIPRGNTLGMISGVIIILTILLVGALFGYDYLQKSKVSSTDSKIKDVNGQLDALADTDKKVIALQSQIDNINLALNQRNFYSQFFAKLTPLIPKDTVFTTLSFSENEIQVSGQAVSFDSVARLLASIRNSQDVDNVLLSSATAGDSSKGGLGVSFSMSIKVAAQAIQSGKNETINGSGNSNQNNNSTNEGLTP